MALSAFDYVVSHPWATALVTYLIYTTSLRFHYLYFHPLAKFPGPRIRAAFYWPYHWDEWKGIAPFEIQSLHKKYGPVVRLSPDKLSFVTSQAWKDIHGFRSEGKGRHQIPKDYKRFMSNIGVELPLFDSNDADHARIRRLLAHAFSETALREQESLVRGHVLKLISLFRTKIQDPSAPGKVDFSHYSNLLAFDVIADLTFGESLHGLDTDSEPKLVRSILGSFFTLAVLLLSWDYLPVKLALNALFQLPNIKGSLVQDAKTRGEKVDKRMALKDHARKDFMTYIMRYNDSRGVSQEEIYGLTAVLLAAGGEESASLISSTLFCLLKHHSYLAKVRNEILDLCSSIDEIKNQNLSQLRWLNAVISETLRVRPPIAEGHFARRTEIEELIDGYVVPADTSVEVSVWSANLDTANFAEAETFAPERWLDEAPEKFQNDDRAASQPFSLGPRNCIGKNLAYMEVRVAIALLLWSFDIEICEESKSWDKGQKFQIGWHRPALWIHLNERK